MGIRILLLIFAILGCIAAIVGFILAYRSWRSKK